MPNLNDNLYTQTSSFNIRKGDGGFAQYDPKPEVLIDKTFTENGEYSAADDNADGYSEVSVDVSGSDDPLNFQQVNFAYGGFDTWGYTTMVSVVRNELGLYDVTGGAVSKPTPPGTGTFTVKDAVVCIEPVVKIYTPTGTSRARTIIFTPSSEFVGIYNQYGEILVSSSSVTPGDNKTYKYYIAAYAQSGNLTKSTSETFAENGYKIVK